MLLRSSHIVHLGQATVRKFSMVRQRDVPMMIYQLRLLEKPVHGAQHNSPKD